MGSSMHDAPGGQRLVEPRRVAGDCGWLCPALETWESGALGVGHSFPDFPWSHMVTLFIHHLVENL